MRIVIAGGGYVGLATAVGLARQGNDVSLVEIDPERAAQLLDGRIPFYEPSLDAAYRRCIASGIIRVCPEYPKTFDPIDFAFICVDTSPTEIGFLDTSRVIQAAEALAACCPQPLRLVVRSTVNPGTGVELERTLNKWGKVDVLVNPEFLREGSSLFDFENPARRVIGGSSTTAVNALASLYSKFSNASILCTDLTTAELIKLGTNASLAVRVSLANEIAHVADALGADLDAVLEGIGSDTRIGGAYLRPGLGFGGSCLPKDLAAFRAAARTRAVGAPIFDAAHVTNTMAISRLVSRITAELDQGAGPVAIIGVAFKSQTDSIRESPAINLVMALNRARIDVKIYDPLAQHNAGLILGDSVNYCATLESAISGARVAVVVDPLLWDRPVECNGTRILDAIGRVVESAPSEEREPEEAQVA